VSSNTDKAGQDYWQQVWQDREIPDAHDPLRNDLNAHMFQRLHRFLTGHLFAPDQADLNHQSPGRLIEAGCGASRWLPYFHHSFNFEVAGVDYSAEGCAQAQGIAAKSGVEADIREADLFSPPEDLKGQFDVVFSIGLVEHFDDTADVISHLASMLKPGGRLITLVPNMYGLTGWLQRQLDLEVYNLHVALSPQQLADAHVRCGLEINTTAYLGTLNLGVVNVDRRQDRWWYSIVVRLNAWASKGVWILERMGMPEFANRLTSPFVACAATVPRRL